MGLRPRISNGLRTSATAAALLTMTACGAPPPTSAEDKAFDRVMSSALKVGRPFAVSDLETGAWVQLCVVGEERTSNMLPDKRARPGEEAFESLIDAAAYWSGPGSAFAFVYPDGVEVRPVTALHVNMGQPINRCVSKDQSVLVLDEDSGWRFRDFASGS